MKETKQNQKMSHFNNLIGGYDMKKEEIKDGIHLVQMLFNGLIEAIDEAHGVIEHVKIGDRNQAIARAQKIVFGLQLALDIEKGGDLAKELNDVYGYCIKRLIHAQAYNDDYALQEVRTLITTISSAWALLPMTKEVA